MKILNIIKLGFLFIILSIFSIIFNIIVGFIGIKFFYGTIVAIIITLICLYFRVILPLYVGSFFGMIYSFNWHWTIAILICLPGIFFITPKLFGKMINKNILKKIIMLIVFRIRIHFIKKQ